MNCLDRNSEITRYSVTFGPTNKTVTGTDNRVFSATGLIPRTRYTFRVSPVSDSGPGPAAEVTRETDLSTGTTINQFVHMHIINFMPLSLKPIRVHLSTLKIAITS